MTVFSQRLKMEALFNKWCEENGIVKRPQNVIAFLDINGLIDEEKFHEFLKEHSTDGHAVWNNNDVELDLFVYNNHTEVTDNND